MEALESNNLSVENYQYKNPSWLHLMAECPLKNETSPIRLTLHWLFVAILNYTFFELLC